MGQVCSNCGASGFEMKQQHSSRNLAQMETASVPTHTVSPLCLCFPCLPCGDGDGDGAETNWLLSQLPPALALLSAPFAASDRERESD